MMPENTADPGPSRVRIERILCPVDLSEISKDALNHARALALWYDADLTVLEVVWAGLPPIAYPGAISSGPDQLILRPEDRAAFVAELEAFSRPDAGKPAPRTAVSLAEGPILPAIVKAADQWPADLIVLGSHGRGGFDRLLLGSVADRVLRKAKCPVLTIPPRTDHTSSPTGRYRTVVCAVDFSPASIAGLRYALALAEETAATLVLVHVLDWSPELVLKPEADGRSGAHQRATQEAAATLLAEAVPDACRDWCTTEEVVVTGRPHEEIVKLAGHRHADLIVIGVHGRSSLDLAFFGSTASQVVRSAPCPVLTVRT